MYGTLLFCHCFNIILASFQAISISHMEAGNQTVVLKFILLGLSEDMDSQPLLFGLFLSMFLVTVLGNLLIILAISSDSHLHTPMYFFLSNLSLPDIGFPSITVLEMLVNIQTWSNTITYEGCITQMYFFMIFAGLDNLFLTVMAYDRFVAICHPLRYTVIMNLHLHLCGLLLLLSWLLVVSLFYGVGLGVYLTSGTTHPFRKGSIGSVMYTVVTPMLNPFIYSLRNRDMKRALRRLFRRGAYSQ
ncbi:olfactory receptor 7D4-like [Mirounga leonina]|uniref:olfactory receptor 7D4-like n=1 Tax=Mirounga leonina TaxID=9715 RepID=UPI00156BFE10|nr:olfactory receptor 7D4-like [Mirounga leonina]